MSAEVAGNVFTFVDLLTCQFICLCVCLLLTDFHETR